METFKLNHGAKRLCRFRQLYHVKICSLRSTFAIADNDGLILVSAFILESTEAQATLDQIRKRGLPVVELSQNYGVDTVNADYLGATKEVMS